MTLKLVFITMKSGDKESSKLVIKDDEVFIDSKRYSIDDFVSLTGEIIEHIDLYERTGEEFFKRIIPSGVITFEFKDGFKISFNTLNPIVKVEELVFNLNIIYDSRKMRKFTVVETSTYKAVYKRL